MATAAKYSYRDLYTVAKLQRRLMRIVLWSFVSCVGVVGPAAALVFLVDGTPTILQTILMWSLIASITIAYVCCVFLAIVWFSTYVGLLKALRPGAVVGVISIVAAFIPLVSIGNLLLVILKASRTLRQAGFKVGVLGVDKQTLQRIREMRDSQPRDVSMQVSA